MARTILEIRSSNGVAYTYKLARTIAFDYTQSAANIARSSLMNKYDISESTYYTLLDMAITHHLINDEMVRKILEKKKANQKSFGNKGYDTQSRHDLLLEQRSSYSAFTKKDIKQDNYKVLSASCNIPVINRPVEIDGVTYFDGGFADPIPIKKAFEEGCDKVVLILTRLRDVPRSPKRDGIFAKFLRLKYPNAAEGLKNRAKNYNEALEYAKKLEKEGKVLILSPKDVYGLDTLTRNKESMQKLYEDGKKDAEVIQKWLKNN